MTTPLLEIRDLVVDYETEARTVRAVDRVTFTIDEGEVFGLAGESGCGKSTIANAVLRLLREPAVIEGGEIRFDGTDVLALTPDELRAFRWSRIAMVFQSAMNALNPVMTVGDQLCDIFTTHRPVSRRAAWPQARELLDMVGIPRDRMKAYPHQLSGGMRQRVVIGMALALRPKLLILDEPTTALDVVVQQEIMAQIKELQAELGFAVLFITHDMSLMVELSDRMAVMYAGRFVETGAARDVFANPLHPYTSALMNAFPPLTGPRQALKGLGEGARFRAIPDLVEQSAGHWSAPVHEGDLIMESMS